MDKQQGNSTGKYFNILWQTIMEKNRKKRLYVYNWVTLLYSRDWDYIVHKSEVAQSCPTLCDRMDRSLPGSSVHGIFQAKVLERVAFSFSRRSSQPRDRTRVSRTAGRHFIIWATREAPSGTKEGSIVVFSLEFHLKGKIKAKFETTEAIFSLFTWCIDSVLGQGA